jgi:CHAT domain-containing protein
VGPAATQIQAGNHMIVVPDGPLCRLSFDTLVDSANPRRYLVQTASLSYAPSLWLLWPQRTIGFRPASLLLVGAPSNIDRQFPPLPGAETELKSIAARFAGAEKIVLKGAQADPRHFREVQPERFSIIHFAAHAVANAVSPLDSAIILSGTANSGKLYAHDFQIFHLHARLVTLSACRSAGARTLPGEGLVGFAWALLRAGARNVIAGLWDVPDFSTQALMDRFYLHLELGDTPADALRRAKLDFIHDHPNHRKPYYWAGFSLYAR